MATILPFDPNRLRGFLQPLSGDSSDLDAAVEKVSNARFVLIGEATHGTHEFYKIRAEITKRLLREHDFAAVAIEGDWPDAYRVHRYACGTSDDADAIDALSDFRRFPSWMWRNADVVDFIGWLRSFNDERPAAAKAGFFGLDLYSLYASINAVVKYLERVDPGAAESAKERYACFDQFGSDVEAYARSVGSGLSESCRTEVLSQLLEMQRDAFSRVSPDEGERFFAEQNAYVVAGAEQYYRTMLEAGVSSWNLRDRFMFLTLERLSLHLEKKRGATPKIVVWAHNSHVGDARATTMGAGREFNIGQLARENYRSNCRLIGFTTSEGTVTAASGWHGEPERKVVRPPARGSWEEIFHHVGVPNFYIDLTEASARFPDLRAPLLERAIGVIYLPHTELHSHYFHARLGEQFDAVFHYDRTRAVEPIERAVRWERGEVPETFPSGV